MKKMITIKFEDKLFPEKLRNIRKPPRKLYAIGNVDLLNKPSLAIVGTRNITEYGIHNCEQFVQKLVEKDIPIVSGMAIGTDTIAHSTALNFGGETIAVLGSGFDYVFPAENYQLFERIIENNGLVVTEYPPKTNVKSERFLERNRIVSGLSEGVLIIEAGYRSGTSVTAKHAYRQGKVVMALPGRLDNPYGVGVNKLIQDGAKLITDIDDILEIFPQFAHKKWKANNQISLFEENNKYQEIIEILQNKTLSVEEIMLNSKEKDIQILMNTLLNMELENIIEQVIGEGYKLI